MWSEHEWDLASCDSDGRTLLDLASDDSIMDAILTSAHDGLKTMIIRKFEYTYTNYKTTGKLADSKVVAKLVPKLHELNLIDIFLDTFSARDLEFVKEVIEVGLPEMTFSNDIDDTILLLAASKGAVTAFQNMIDRGRGDINCQNIDGRNLLEVAINDEIVDIILKSDKFVAERNIRLKRTGSTLLQRLCSVQSNAAGNEESKLFQKVEAWDDDLRIAEDKKQNFEDNQMEVEMRDAAQKAHSNQHRGLIWLIMRSGHCKSLDDEVLDDLKTILETGESLDQRLKDQNGNVLHALAKANMASVIEYMQDSKNTLEMYFERHLNKNNEGDTPAMTAAKGNKSDSLLILLHPFYEEFLVFRERHRRHANRTSVSKIQKCKEVDLHTLLHGHDGNNRTLLAIVGCHRQNLNLAHSILVQLEEVAHNNDRIEIMKCVREHNGSSADSSYVVNIVKEKYPNRCTGYCERFVAFFLHFSLPCLVFSLDVLSDLYVIFDYAGDMKKSTVHNVTEIARKNCADQLTLSCFVEVTSPTKKFIYSLFFLLLPVIFYMWEAFQIILTRRMSSNDQNMKQSKCGTGKKIADVMTLVMLWPFRMFWDNWRHQDNFHKSSNEQKVHHKCEGEPAYYNSAKAHLLEICLESSWMPLLQLYLVLPVLIEWGPQLEDITLRDFALEMGQISSVILSVISVSYGFTAYHMKTKRGAASTLSMIVYFFSTLFLVVSRLLAFVTFSYYFGLEGFHFPFLWATGHVFMMALLHVLFEPSLPNSRCSKALSCCSEGGFQKCCKKYSQFMYWILNGVANLYVHNRIYWYGKEDKTATALQTFARHITYETIFAVETILMIVHAFMAPVTKVDQSYQSTLNDITIAVAILWILGICLKIIYYLFIHVWAAILRGHIRSIFPSSRRKTSWFVKAEDESGNSMELEPLNSQNQGNDA